jgi:predicted DNA-binding transcriptional regulator AlpA
MNKKEVAAYLGLSEKTVERYKASGKLSARLRRVVGGDGKTRKVLDFEQPDVERLRGELAGDIVFPNLTDGQPQTNRQTGTDRQPQTNATTDTDIQTRTDRESSTNNNLSRLGQTPTDAEIQTQTANPIEMILASVENVIGKNLEVFRASGKLLLNLRECRVLTGLSDATLRAAIREGKLAGQIIVRGYKIKRSELDKFIDSL